MDFGDIDGHRTGHPYLAAARTGLGLSAETVGVIHQFLVGIAATGQRNRLALNGIIAGCCQPGMIVFDDDHVVSSTVGQPAHCGAAADPKSTRLHSSHTVISYGVVCMTA